MNKISVAIPTYFSSTFINNTINSLKDAEVVDEIVIRDDSESSSEYKDLDKIVRSLLEDTEINLTILKNKENLGGYKNKYRCIELSSNDYVYQIDSDNLANPKSLKYLYSMDLDKLDKSVIHIPSRIYLFKKYKNERFINFKKNVKYLKKTKILDSDDIKKILLSNEKFVINKNIDWVLNTGNPFFYKNSYLTSIEKGLSYSKDTLSADAIAMIYFWTLSGNNVSISKFLSHFHKLRDESYYVTEGATADKSIAYFKNEFKKI